MPTTCWKFFVVCGLCLILSIPARAQPLFAHTESIESTVANSDLVFIANLVKIAEEVQGQGRPVHNTVIAIEETLKKRVFKDEPYRQLQMYMPHKGSVLADWKKRSARLLIAYDEYARHETTVIELRDGLEVMTADMKLLRDPDAVIRAAKNAVQSTPPAVKRVHTFKLAVPRKLVAETQWDTYYDTGGHLTLGVPVDARLEKRAQKSLRSKNYMQRIEGARALRYFKSDENVARVKTLLDDPGSYAFRDKGVEVRHYGVREEAYRTLKHWKVEVNKPVVRERRERPKSKSEASGGPDNSLPSTAILLDRSDAVSRQE